MHAHFESLMLPRRAFDVIIWLHVRSRHTLDSKSMYTQCVLSLNRPNDVHLHCEHEFRIISEFAIICRLATAKWEGLCPTEKKGEERGREKRIRAHRPRRLSRARCCALLPRTA